MYRRYEGNRQFFSETGADGLGRKKFRTSGNAVVVLSALSIAAYASLIVLTVKLQDWIRQSIEEMYVVRTSFRDLRAVEKVPRCVDHQGLYREPILRVWPPQLLNLKSTITGTGRLIVGETGVWRGHSDVLRKYDDDAILASDILLTVRAYYQCPSSLETLQIFQNSKTIWVRPLHYHEYHELAIRLSLIWDERQNYDMGFATHILIAVSIAYLYTGTNSEGNKQWTVGRY